MIELVLVYCLAAGDGPCVERRPLLEEVSGPTACMLAAQPIAAQFLRDHPAYRLASFKCEVGRRRERSA